MAIKIASAVLAVCILIVISLNLTVGHKAAYTCLDCGLSRFEKAYFGHSIVRDDRNSRTDWYDRRRGGVHDHRWVGEWHTDLNVLGHEVGSRNPENREPRYFEAGLVRVLRRLEPLDLDVAYHRALTHQNAEHRKAAWDAFGCFDPRWTDVAVRDWWRKTRAYLEAPEMWAFEFKWETHPFDRTPR